MPSASPTDAPSDKADTPPRASWRAPLLWRVLLRMSRTIIPLFCRLRVTGEIPDTLRHSRLILASNHIGTFDPFVLIAACAKMGLSPRLLATGGLFHAPILGPIMRRSGHIQVDRGQHTVTQALHGAIEALDEESCVVIYPEGGITLDPGVWPQRGKTGVARLAFATDTPVLTVAQWGAHEVMAWDHAPTMARTLLTALFRRPETKIHFGSIIDLSDVDPRRHDAARRATDHIMHACIDDLIALRPAEPYQPHRIDAIRPLSTARSLRTFKIDDA